MTRILNEFQSSLYPSTRHMIESIAEEWISAGGSWSKEAIAETLHDYTNDELAAECVEGWGLDFIPDDDSNESHMTFNGYSSGDLSEAFNDMR